jgi:phage I-like protein
MQHGSTGGLPEMRGFLVLNRQFDPDSTNFTHLIPFGEHPGVAETPEGRVPIVQVFDSESHRRILEAYNSAAAKPGWTGLLVDREHLSHDPKGDSSAYAWIKAPLAVRPDGIYGILDQTDLGREVIANRRYKRLSPVLSLERIAGNKYRPVELIDVGLTNKAVLTSLNPILNRAGQQHEEVHMLDKLRTLLGKADATEGEIPDLVVALQTRATAAETQLNALKAESLNRAADEFVTLHKAVIKDPAKVKALFVANRQQAEELIAALNPTPTQIALNRADAHAPTGSPDDSARASQQDAEVKKLMAQNRCSYGEAAAILTTTMRDLFQPIAKA